jgi:hypothetical protein
LCLFGGLAAVIGACFESPEYPNTPKISFESVVFIETNSDDTLTLSISFQDGNGDLGLPDDSSDPRYDMAPFNRFTYAIKTKAAGVFIDSIIPRRFSPEDAATYRLEALDVIVPTFADHGTILSDIDLDDPAYYNTMPADVYPFSCVNYGGQNPISVYVLESDNLVDASFEITDTIPVPGDRIFKVVGRFYRESNPNTANIDVVFEYTPANDGQWKEFNFTTDNPSKNCAPSFNGRFPILTEDDGSLDGIIRYHMKSNGFYDIFQDRQIRLKVKIRDRALNVSNEITTPPFTLTSIKK